MVVYAGIKTRDKHTLIRTKNTATLSERSGFSENYFQESLRPTVQLNTSLPGLESALSAIK